MSDNRAPRLLDTPTVEQLRQHLLAQLEGRFWFLPVEDIEDAFHGALEDVREFRRQMEADEEAALSPEPDAIRFRVHVWLSDPEDPPKSIPSRVVTVPPESLREVRDRLTEAIEAPAGLVPLSGLVASLLDATEDGP